MNKISKYVLKTLLVMLTVAGCVYGGRVDYNDAVESEMGYEIYKYISDSIGSTSRSEIISEYMNNREYYNLILK